MYEVNDSLEQKLSVILRQSSFFYQNSLDAYWQQEWEDLANLSITELNILSTDEDSRRLPALFSHDKQISAAQPAPLPWSKWERVLAFGFVGSVLLHAGILTLQLPAPRTVKTEKHTDLIMTQLAKKVPQPAQSKLPDPKPLEPAKTEVAQKAPRKVYSSRPIMSSESDAIAGPSISTNMIPGSQGNGLGTDKGTGSGTATEGVPNGTTDETVAKVPSAPPPPQPSLITTKPLLRSDITPEYPDIAKQNNWEGRVIVLAHISETGVVELAEVARSSGHAELDEAALAAVKTSRFEPARRGNEAISGTVRVPITFSLE